GIHRVALEGVPGAYCAPFEAQAWRRALAPFLDAPDPRSDGRSRAALFSADVMAARVVTAWRELVHDRTFAEAGAMSGSGERGPDLYSTAGAGLACAPRSSHERPEATTVTPALRWFRKRRSVDCGGAGARSHAGRDPRGGGGPHLPARRSGGGDARGPAGRGG